MSNSLNQRLQFKGAALHSLAALLIVLPWLNPVSYGPSPNVAALLVTGACLALAMGCLALSQTEASAAGDWQIVIGAWLMAALCSAAIGIAQYFGFAELFVPWVRAGNAGQAYSNLAQRNQFAGLLSLGLLSLIWVACHAAPAANARTKGLLLVGAAMVLLASANAASLSRTGALQWVVIALLYLVWSRSGQRRPFWLACAALVAYVLAAAVLPRLLDAWTGTQAGGMWGRIGEDVGCQSRMVLWKNVIALIAQRPWTGWGWGELDYAHFITAYDGERFCDILDNAHNLPLHLAVELGLPAAVLLCGLVAWWIVASKPWRETDPMRQVAWGGLAVIGLHSLLEYPLWYGPFQVAALACLCKLRAVRAPNASARRRRTTLVAAAALLGLCGWVYGDYWRANQIYVAPQNRAAAYQEDTLRRLQQDVGLFTSQVLFAKLNLTSVTPDNAEEVNALAKAMLHFSPEPGVVEKLLDSAVLMGAQDDVRLYADRYHRAFPAEYARWAARHAVQPQP